MGGVLGLAVLLIAGWMLLPAGGTGVPVTEWLAAVQAWWNTVDWSSAGSGFVAGAILGRLAGVRWGEIPGRALRSLSYHGHGFSLLGWVLVLAVFVVMF